MRRRDVMEPAPKLLAGVVARAARADFGLFEAQFETSGVCAHPVRLTGHIDSTAHVAPHVASILAATNVPPRRAIYLLGHTDAKLTLSVYQQVLDVRAGSIEVLEGVLGCSLHDACDVLTGRVLVASSYPELGGARPPAPRSEVMKRENPAGAGIS